MGLPRVLFFRPPFVLPRVSMDYYTIVPPLGIGYLASVIERAGYTVSILDAPASGWNRESPEEDPELLRVGLTDAEITAEIRNFNPDIVGITNPFTAQFSSALKTATLIKRLKPDIKVVLGGVHPSAMPHQCIVSRDIDFLIKGEGENPMLELLQALQGRYPLSEVKGLYYKKNGEIVFNGLGEPIKDLDDIPFPAYHLMPMDKYFAASRKDMTLRGGFHDRWAPIITSRGCPYSCNFCSVSLMEGHHWRYRSPKNIVDEIELLYKEYNIRRITIEDSNFTLNISRAEAVCDEVIRRKLKIKWSLPNGVRADKFSEGLLEKMKSSGCMEITLGIEHGDAQFLNNVIKKGLDLKVVEENVKKIRKAGMSVSGFFIVGIPQETRQTAYGTIKMAAKLARQGMMSYVNIAMPLPGTEMYKECVKNGYVSENLSQKDYLLMGHSRPLISTTYLTPDDIIALRLKIYLAVLINMLFTHPIILLKAPFVKATIADLLNPYTFLLRLKKIAKILFPGRG